MHGRRWPPIATLSTRWRLSEHLRRNSSISSPLLRVGRSERRQLHHDELAEAPAAREVDDSPDRRVIRSLVGSRRIEHDQGARVRPLARSPDREDSFGGLAEATPLDFSDRDGLCPATRGAGVLYNTYWVRFARGRDTFGRAVGNTTE